MSSHGVPAQAGAIVFGGNLRALGVVRSLGRRRVPAWVLTDDHCVAAYSRYCLRSMPWPAENDARRLDFLMRLGERHRLDGWMLFPTTDFTAAFFARHHSRLSEIYVLTTPPWDEYVRLTDKWYVYTLAAQLGIDQPATYRPGSLEAARLLDCRFPVVVKPSLKQGNPNALSYAKALPARSRAELIACYEEASTFVDPDLIIVQEQIPGEVGSEFAYAALCKDGQPLASLSVHKPRQHPIEITQGSTCVETVDLPEVEAAGKKLVASLRYTGIVEVAFMQDPRDGEYKLLDINPRAWTWHSIGRTAGVDFPYLLWRMMRDEPVPVTRAKLGVKWIRMLLDVPTSLQMIRRGLLSPREYLDSLRGPKEFAIFSIDDPLPGLVDAPLLARLALQRKLV